MSRILVFFGRAIKLWWGEFLFLLLLNVVWLVAQLTIVFGPPATAALYVVAQKVVDRELVGFKDFWQAMRQHFGVSWLWGAAQIIVYGVLIFNMAFYGGREAVIYLSLRYAWTLLLFFWFAINLYFWPLYLAQTEQRFGSSLGNASKMFLVNPGYTVLFALLALALVTISTLSGLLLGAALGTWLTLWSLLVVQDRLDKAGPMAR